ncbi:nucleic acid/nucleotide deaminase domain-containing protein [Catellatospora aurea]|uniref:Nucleic acid/nucleotide deaminase domain-containing protein n=1 Tax=Catellatospora aurea TaxID=1337874 RepID=A0ABW2GSQ5_9ACTN
MSALLMVTLAYVPAQAGQDHGAPAVERQAGPAKGAGRAAEIPKRDPSADKTMRKPDSVVWPAGGAADVDAMSVDTSLQEVGGLPFDIARGAEGHAADAPRKVRVKVLQQAVSQALAVDAPVFKVYRTDGEPNARKVNVRIGYGRFAHARGGDWGARLRMVALPACALTAPDKPECRTGRPLVTINDSGAQTLSAEVDAAAAESGAMAFTMMAGEASVQGDFKATKLAPSSSWSTSLSSGAFTWTYPIRTPGTPGGLGPSIALSYSSQTVDGRTTATNNQGSWLGEGFSYEPGYIERQYKSCDDDGHEDSAEKCWAFQNGTMMLSGRSGTLVKVTDNLWRLSDDDGSKIERLTGASNGDNDGEHWRVTTTDGTQYYFGKNRLPGWSTGKEVTESVWTVPVFGDDSGEPCHDSGGFADSWCNQAWRWNLDYVVDPRGNVVSYFYDAETNHYARSGKTDVDGTAYHRGGWLARIDYGQRDQQVYSTSAPARVVFHTAERCIPGGSVDCDPGDLDEDTAASWPDVPEDLICAANTHCEWTQSAATFFTRKRLTKIETQIRQGAGWSPVESWALEHEFKVNDDNSRTLWLKKITNTGHWGDPDITLPATELEGIQLPNRIVKTGDNLGPLIRYRLATVKTDSGAQISVNYAPADCSKDNLPTPGNSDRRCFPVIWNPLGGDDEDEVTDWFHKYVVASVVEDDLVGGNDDMVAAYEYVGDAGWRKDEPDGIGKAEDLTWSDWRGYKQVTVRSGNGQSMPGRTDHFFLRGLSGGKQANGSTPAVNRTDSTGASYTDHDQWSGHELETIVYNGSDVIKKTINQPWRHITRTQTEDWGSRQSAYVRVDVVRNLISMPDDAQGNDVWREVKTVTSFDTAWGRALQVEDLGDVATSGDDKCVQTWYADNPDTYMYMYVSRTRTVSVGCGLTPDLNTQLVADARTSFDLKAYGEPPVKGIRTRSESLDRYDGTDTRYLVTSETTTQDGYGRATTVKDAGGHATTTAFVETDGLTTQTTVTSPAPFSHVTTTTQDPAYGVPTVIEDVNLNRSDLAYDALGRLAEVWRADRSKAQGAAPSMRFTYTVRNDKPSVIKTETLRNDGSYRPTYELFDGMLRPRQTQAPGSGGWLLADTFYNGVGQAYKTNKGYLATGTPGDIPIVTAEGSVNGQTTFTYDQAGRQIVETFSVAGDARWSTSTTYEGDRVHVDPPAGGIATTTVSGARGQVTELRQYHGDSPSGPADVTHYTYTPSGQLETVTDPSGNKWTYHYNQRGLKEWIEDPDSGETHYTYDAIGNVGSATDERGNTLSYKYDELNRKTEMWQGQIGSGTKLAAWVYDSLAGNKGQLHYSQRLVDGQSYYTVYAMRDKLYRPLKVNYSFPAAGVGTALGKSYQFTTAYNTDGTVQSTGFPAAGGLLAEAVVTSYDGLQRATGLSGTSSYVTSTLHGDLGELRQAELFTGGANKKAWLTYEYERGTGRLVRSRVDRQGVATIDMDARYHYDAAGNVLSIADGATTPGGTDVQCFEHDHLRRLTEAWSHASTTKACADGVDETGVGGPAPYRQSWTFDAVGNRETETVHALSGGTDTERDYHYADAGEPGPHLLRSVSEAGPGGAKTYAYEYDSSGNTVCRPAAAASNNCATGTGSQNLTWDAEGHLATSAPAGGQPTTYIYDADGNRIARKDAGGSTTLFLPGMDLAASGSTVTGTRYYGFGGQIVAVRNSTGVHFTAADHHGTASCTINAVTGAITWRRTTPYGGTRGTPPSAWPDTKGFVGGTEDPTGLVHLGAREYDPSTGRFVSIDLLMDPYHPQTLHGYVYGNNSPVTFSDPTGNDWWDPVANFFRRLGEIDDKSPYLDLTCGTAECINFRNKRETGHDDMGHTWLTVYSGVPVVDSLAMNADAALYRSEGNEKAAAEVEEAIQADTNIAMSGVGLVVPGVLVRWFQRLARLAKEKKLIGKIAPDGSDLARMVQGGRGKLADPMSGKNGAVFEYIDAKGKKRTTMMFSDWPIHAERLIWAQLEKQGVKPNQVTRIYTEFQPCSTPTVKAGCNRFVNDTFTEAKVTWAWEYDDQASRLRGKAEKAKYLAQKYG